MNERTKTHTHTRNALSLSVSCLRTVWECSMFILFSYWFNRRERNASTIDWLTRWRVHICDHILWSVCTHIVYIQTLHIWHRIFGKYNVNYSISNCFLDIIAYFPFGDNAKANTIFPHAQTTSETVDCKCTKTFLIWDFQGFNAVIYKAMLNFVSVFF